MNIVDVNKAADAYLADASGPAAVRLRFLKGLWNIQADIEARTPEFETPDAESAVDALASGQPLFLVSAPHIPADAYRSAVERVSTYCADEAGLDEAQTELLRDGALAASLTNERIASAMHDPDGFVSGVVEAIATSGGPASTLSQATAAFVLLSALSPFVTTASAAALEALGEYSWSVWGSGTCPVCGSAAALGRMTEGGELKGAERHLWCSLCHAEWNYDRIRCARCGTRTADALRYSYEEGDPAHRLHLCERCHGYLKVTFENETDRPISMLVEEAATVALDAIAHDAGYSPTPEMATD